MEIARSSRREHTVNLTPLIDVVFLLIVFFMLSTTFVVSESMELSLPSKGADASTSSDVWVLRVDADGNVNHGGDQWSISQFDRKLRQKLRDDVDQKILVLSEEGVSVQELINVLDIIYINGGKQVQMDHAAHSDIGSEVILDEESGEDG